MAAKTPEQEAAAQARNDELARRLDEARRDAKRVRAAWAAEKQKQDGKKQ